MIFLMKEIKEEQFLKYKFSSERGDGGKFASAIEGTLITKKFGLFNFGQNFQYFGRLRTKISDKLLEAFLLYSPSIWQFYLTLVTNFEKNIAGLCKCSSYLYQRLLAIKFLPE